MIIGAALIGDSEQIDTIIPAGTPLRVAWGIVLVCRDIPDKAFVVDDYLDAMKRQEPIVRIVVVLAVLVAVHDLSRLYEARGEPTFQMCVCLDRTLQPSCIAEVKRLVDHDLLKDG